jgi:hypothetical protein
MKQVKIPTHTSIIGAARVFPALPSLEESYPSEKAVVVGDGEYAWRYLVVGPTRETRLSALWTFKLRIHEEYKNSQIW